MSQSSQEENEEDDIKKANKDDIPDDFGDFQEDSDQKRLDNNRNHSWKTKF